MTGLVIVLLGKWRGGKHVRLIGSLDSSYRYVCLADRTSGHDSVNYGVRATNAITPKIASCATFVFSPLFLVMRQLGGNNPIFKARQL